MDPRNAKTLAKLILGSKPELAGGTIVRKTVVVGKPAPDGEDPKEGLHSAAEEALQAIKDDDAEAFAEAMQSFFDMCDSYDDEQDKQE